MRRVALPLHLDPPRLHWRGTGGAARWLELRRRSRRARTVQISPVRAKFPERTLVNKSDALTGKQENSDPRHWKCVKRVQPIMLWGPKVILNSFCVEQVPAARLGRRIHHVIMTMQRKGLRMWETGTYSNYSPNYIFSGLIMTMIEQS